MAKNQEPEKPVDSGSETESGSTDDGSSEPEQTQITKKPSLPPPAAAKKPQPETHQQKPASSSSEEEESGSESDESDPPKSSGGARKPTPATAATPAKPAVVKRPAEEKESEAAKEAKKPKRVEAVAEKSEAKSNDDSKKSGSQRVWSEDDEIVVLKGMIDYRKKSGSNSSASAEANALRELIKDDLDVDASANQLQEKIRRMKKKYETSRGKEKEGKELGLKPHEQRAFELSKLVWGDESGQKNAGEKSVGSSKVKGSVVRKTQSSEVTNGSVDKLAVSGLTDVGENLVGSPKVNGILVKRTQTRKVDDDAKNVEGVNGDLMRLAVLEAVSSKDMSIRARVLWYGAAMFEGGSTVEGAREWNRLRAVEVEIEVKRLETMHAQSKLVMDVLKSGE